MFTSMLPSASYSRIGYIEELGASKLLIFTLALTNQNTQIDHINVTRKTSQAPDTVIQVAEPPVSLSVLGCEDPAGKI